MRERAERTMLQASVQALSAFLSQKVKMGNIQGAVVKPSRPYERKGSSLFGRRRGGGGKNSTLLQLVARRDWQKVLIRATLFPAEIARSSKLTWYGTTWKVLPLHLACALNAPATVIQKLLHLHADNASLTMTRTRRLTGRRRLFRKTPKIQEGTTTKTEEALSEGSRDHDMHEDEDDEDCEEMQIEGAKSCRMEWNVDPLLEEADCMLPLHLACLYRASPDVLSHLIKLYPAAAKTMACGMLPIHMLCANFDIPPPIEAPDDHIALLDDWRLCDALRVLVDAYPEALEIASENHGVTPKEYIEETMEDGEDKTSSLWVLGVEPEDLVDLDDDASDLTDDTGSDTETIPDEIRCSAPSAQRTSQKAEQWQAHTPLYGMLQAQDWEGAHDLIDESPEKARQWQYGIEIDSMDTGEPQLWKRLPIHNACRFGAPLELVYELLRLNSVSRPDPYTGALPIHLACRYHPVVEMIDALLVADPKSAKHTDHGGRLPLHYAFRFCAPTVVLQSLIKAFPGSVAALDAAGMTPLDYAGENVDAVFFKTMRRLEKFLTRVDQRKRKDMYKSPATVKTEAETVVGLEISCHSDPLEEEGRSQGNESLSMSDQEAQFDLEL